MDIFESLEEKCDYWHSLLNYVIDEHIPVKKKHVGTQDVPYVTKNWKKAIRDKRKAAKAHANNRIEGNWEMKRKTRNAATKQRRIAINKFLKVKSEELNSNLNTGILQNFQTSSGEGKWILWLWLYVTACDIGTVAKDQNVVAEEFAGYFSTLANDRYWW